ncbi:hypothetical protein OE88DRAFT_1687269 [Heliocybe sulcata]|uniref:RRM domain-containing protein n=1 Tax=Heliocybe sulcata TaxID=5364 RepID=A0A5C3MPZ8_9AGAM|nr:hypothetical protein OE88DRAFT_1687269 [Heliocybe sulcata]
MHAPLRGVPPRYNTYHGPKARVLGNTANHIPPAWRANNAVSLPTGPSAKVQAQPGSKIFISNLPMDVSEKEVEELFQKTVGPLKDVLLVYNSQGRSKGMAVVTFQRSGDAAAARSKYHNKIVDGKRPIKIEIVVDDVPSSSSTAQPAARAPAQPKSLLQRLGGAALTGAKGARRVNKRPVPKTVADLDQEMDDYRAALEA